MIEVVAALIHQDDQILIAQRSAKKARPLLWEFIGGKVEKNETKQQTLIRECKEEMDIDIKVEDIVTEVAYSYPDVTIHLTLLSCVIVKGTPKCLEHEQMKWIHKDELLNYEFCPADTAFIPYILKKEA